MAETKWATVGEYGDVTERNVTGPLTLRTWWASGTEPRGSTLPPYKVSVFGYTLKTRFDTRSKAIEAAEKVALKWALAAMEELKEGESDAT